MNKLLDYFGYDNTLEAKHRFTYIINSVSISLVLMFFIFYLVVVRSALVNGLTIICLTLLTSVFFFMKSKHYFTAKIFLLLGFVVQEFALVFLWFAKDSNLNYFFFIVAPISFFVCDFSILRERIYIVLANILAILLLLASETMPVLNLIELPSIYTHILSIMSVISTALSISVVFYFYASNLSKTHRELLYLAKTDSLTKTYNRRVLFDEGHGLFDLTRKYNRTFALMLLDIDHFKNINDTYGHPAGDAVLRQLSDLIQKNIRHDDIFSRFGGEEFAIILRDSDADANLTIARNLQQFIGSHVFYTDQQETLSVTVSVGVTSYSDGFDDFDAMVSCADKALYLAKSEGRNQVVHTEACE